MPGAGAGARRSSPGTARARRRPGAKPCKSRWSRRRRGRGTDKSAAPRRRARGPRRRPREPRGSTARARIARGESRGWNRGARVSARASSVACARHCRRGSDGARPLLARFAQAVLAEQLAEVLAIDLGGPGRGPEVALVVLELGADGLAL